MSGVTRASRRDELTLICNGPKEANGAQAKEEPHHPIAGRREMTEGNEVKHTLG